MNECEVLTCQKAGEAFAAGWKAEAEGEKDAILTPAIQRGRGNTGRVTHAKFKIAKISAEGLMAVYAKICTFENFPLYGICSPTQPSQPAELALWRE